MSTLEISLQELLIGNLDPSVTVFRVEVGNETGLWSETFGSDAELRAFLRGMSAKAEFAKSDLPLGFEHAKCERHIIQIAIEDLPSILEVYK